MTQSHPSPLLKRALIADAAVSGASGLLMTLDASLLEPLLGVPADLMFFAGLSLLPWAALVGWLATRPSLSRRAVLAVIVCNALWAVDCVVLLASGFVAPTALGYGFVIAQALVVALFAEIQYFGLRRSAPVAEPIAA